MRAVKNKIFLSDGMTLVELMVAIGVTAIMMTLSISIFMSQHKSFVNIQEANEAQETMPSAMTILQRDLMEAGWSVSPEMAFYFNDGGSTSADQIYLNDVNVIDIAVVRGTDNVSDLPVMVDRRRRACPGCRILNKDNDVDQDDIDGAVLWTAASSVKFDRKEKLDINWLEDKSADHENDFIKNMYIITDSYTPSQKVAKITDVNEDEGILTLSNVIDGYQDSGDTGKYIAPAIYYEIHYDTTNKQWTLRRNDRNTSGSQPMAENIVDMQVAYCESLSSPPSAADCNSDTNPKSKWYCNKPSSECPMANFDPSKIYAIRVTLVTKNTHQDKSLFGNEKYCRPAIENRAKTNMGNTSEKNNECGYKYRVYTTRLTPRNTQQ